MLRIGALLELADLPGFVSQVDAFAQAVERYRQPQFLWLVGLLRAQLAWLDSRFDEAEHLIEEACALGRRVAIPTSTRRTPASRVRWIPRVAAATSWP